ncbi:hypothetical protein GX48_05902 [Paracoccidioides brasiliensis]|nr:hypothetical protein GX48_05902 [Paracoccidioides brasiliensis]
MATNPDHLKPSSSRPSSYSQKPTTPMYKPPLTAHPTATVPDSASFQGIHPISIGAGTVIHPRSKFLSFEGPIHIGDGCIIGEKSVIGGPQASPISSTSMTDAESATTSTEATTTLPTCSSTTITTTLEKSIIIGPLATISAGTHISSAATVDTSSFLGRGVQVGQHAKVCSSCSIPDSSVVDDWTVIWGGGVGAASRLQMRKRVNGQHQQPSDEPGVGLGSGAAIVERGRLGVLEKEREGLTKLIGARSAGEVGRRK